MITKEQILKWMDDNCVTVWGVDDTNDIADIIMKYEEGREALLK